MDNRPLRALLLPGLDGTGVLFRRFVSAAPPWVDPHVIAYPSDIPVGYDGLAEAVRSHLPLSGPFIIVAESFSGPVAITVAASGPPNLRGLVLCNTFVVSPVPSVIALLPLGLFARVQPPPSLLRRFLIGQDAEDDLVAEVRSAVAVASSAILAHRVREILQVDVRRAFHAGQAPVLLLHGSNDRLVPDRVFKQLVSLCPQATATTLSAPHLLLQTHPTEAWEAIFTFLQSQGAG